MGLRVEGLRGVNQVVGKNSWRVLCVVEVTERLFRVLGWLHRGLCVCELHGEGGAKR